MVTAETEALHAQAQGIDAIPREDAALVLANGQIAAATAVRAVAGDIASAATALAETLRRGGTLHYVAAGSSGLMAAADAQELGGTFSIPAAQLRIHMAGGLPTGVEMPGDTEDDTQSLADALSGLGPDDAIIAVSASGTTPYTLEAVRIAKSAGARIIAIANNAGAPLLLASDHPILLATPPEVLSGSTRMGAGTAQKIALNMLSTLMAMELGHVHDGMMVNLRADNIKLRARAMGMVARIAGVTDDAARAALETTDGDVKLAILVAAGQTPGAARTLLRTTEGNLRAALAQIN
ncbi:MAG: N-acetylmuramic acid 6-phosphate etherase [Marivita sp.]|uniref:N-acetylmuramic acid 6-phosphate etherase n=1 Tax=Marivita sp. TaxID=2003365 RepID=UPI0025BCF140|nr:N-acetylmuramic acid 6-phosphate etherase [Marivita sp.]MCI5110731.1 N-acetylmuramic acid 6-phosphate etherase [Marivita sp.]